MWFERMNFERFEGWEVEDGNVLAPTSSGSGTGSESSVFSGSMAILQPQDMRQYLYILTPVASAIPSFPVPHAPGAVFNLGRLDIWWRTALGEPGRLTTSVGPSLFHRRYHI